MSNLEISDKSFGAGDLQRFLMKSFGPMAGDPAGQWFVDGATATCEDGFVVVDE